MLRHRWFAVTMVIVLAAVGVAGDCPGPNPTSGSVQSNPTGTVKANNQVASGNAPCRTMWAITPNQVGGTGVFGILHNANKPSGSDINCNAGPPGCSDDQKWNQYATVQVRDSTMLRTYASVGAFQTQDTQFYVELADERVGQTAAMANTNKQMTFPDLNYMALYTTMFFSATMNNTNNLNIPSVTASGYYPIQLVSRFNFPFWSNDVILYALGNSACNAFYSMAKSASVSNSLITVNFPTLDANPNRFLCISPDNGNRWIKQYPTYGGTGSQFQWTIIDMTTDFVSATTAVNRFDTTADFTMTITHKAIVANLVYALASVDCSQNNLEMPGSVKAGTTTTVLTFKVPDTPGQYGVCLGFEGSPMSDWKYQSAMNNKFTYYRSTPWSAISLTPTAMLMGATPTLTVDTTGVVVGEAISNYATARVAFSLNGVDCIRRTANLTVSGAGVTPTLTGLTASYFPIAQTYKMCYSVNGWQTWDIIQGVTLTVYNKTSTTIRSIYPVSVPCASTVTFQLATTGYLPSTAVLVLASDTACQNPLYTGNMATGSASVTITTACGATAQPYVCYSPDGTSAAYQGLSINVRSNVAIVGVSPTLVLPAASITLQFSSPDIVTPQSYIKLVVTGQACSASGGPPQQPYNGYPVAFTGMLASTTYDTCYSVNNGGTYQKATGVTVTVLPTISASSLTWSQGMAVVGRASQFVTVTPGPAGLSTAIVYLTQGSCGSLGTSWLYDGTQSFQIPVPTSFVAGTAILCFSQDGTSSGALQQNGVLKLVTEATRSLTSSTPANARIAHGQTLALTITGASNTSNTMMTFAPDGLCESVAARFVPAFTYLSASISKTFIIPTVLAGSSQYLVYPCISVNNGPWFSQNSSAASGITVGVALTTSITAMSPSAFVIAAPVIVALTGILATPTTKIALGQDAMCSSILSGCTANYATQTPTITVSGCTFPQAPMTLWLCLAMDGTTNYVPQLLVFPTVTADPFAGAIQTITPIVIGVGNRAPLTLTFGANGQAGTSFYLGFSATGSCTTCNTTCEAITQILTSSPTLGSPFVTPWTTPNSWAICFTPDNKITWSQQVSVSMRSIKATSSYITSISPNIVGRGNMKTMTFGNIDGALTAYIGFVAGAGPCTPAPLAATIQNVPIGATTLNVNISVTSFSAGTYTLCYSTNGTAGTGIWFAQSPPLTVVAATATSVTDMSPKLIGESVLAAMSFTMSASLLSGDTFIALAVGGCSGTKYNPVNLATQTFFTLSTALAANTYVVCLSTQAGVWVQQTTVGLQLLVIGATSTSITSVIPNTIGTGTTPMLSFTGAIPSSTTAVSFVDFAGNCGTGAMLAITPLTTIPNATISQSITVLLDTSMTICYTNNYGNANPNWVAQSMPSVKVLAGGSSSVSNVSPTLVGANVPLTFTLSVAGGITPTSYIAFALSPSACLSSGTRQGTTRYAGSPMTLASFITAAGNYYTCYAVDGPDGTYASQTAPTAQITVVSASAASITSIVPAVIGDSSALTLTVLGISATPTTAISFSLDASCATGRQSVTATTTPGQTVVAMTAGLSPAGPYTVCYTTGAGWVAQTSVSLTVLSATATSLSILTPNFIGASVTLGLTLGSDLLTPLAYVAFAQSGQCGSANLYSVMPYALSVFMTGSLPSAGTYDLCYSVRNGTAGTWVAQSGVHMIAAIPDFYAVAGLFPNGMGSGTLPTLTLTMNDARVAAPQTAMAFVFDTDDCNTVGNRLVVRTVTNWGSFPMPTSINTGGLFRICLSYNLIDWTKQINDSAAMTVIAATPTSVGGIMPTLYQNGQITRVTLTGVTFTSTSVFAFAQTGQCSITRFAQTPYAPGGDGGVDMASPLETGLPAVNLTLCYSVNNGLTWVEQSAILVLAVTACDDADALGTCEQCHKQPYCSWCTSQNLCAVNINGSLCAEEDIVVPGDPIGCPAVTYPSRMTGSTAGMTMVTLGGNGRFFDTDEMSCHWDFIVSTNQTKFTVLSDSSGWCLSPPVQTVNVAYLSVRYRDVPFTSVAQRGVWTYYDCEQRISGLCTDCYNLAKPDCGTCFDTGACQAGFQCAGLWGGALCPAINDIEPQQINFRGGVELEVTGTLFVNSSSMACYFTPTSGATGLVYSNVTYWNETMVTCMAPPFDPQTIVKVTLWDRGLLYTSQPVTIVYLDDPPPAAVIQPPAPLPVDHLTIPLASTIVGLVFIGALILFVVLHRRRKARQALMPPDLTPALKEQIIFGEFKASPNVKQLVPHVTPLMELLLIPNSPILGALIKATESTESDQVSRALVYVTETRSRTIDVMKHVVTLEVKEAESMPTLFRTNSFVTKMFKVYSKIVGLEYVHSTLGYELNASLHSARTGEGEDALDVKDDSNDEVQLNKLILLTVCQRVLLAITKNEKDVPNQFRELFAHVKTCMQTKFPASNESLARLTAGNLSAALMETRMALSQEGPLSANDISNLQMALVSGLADGRMDPGTQSQLSGVAGNVSTLSSQLMATLKACKDMEASMYPDSEEAKRVVAEHNQAQNAIAVGGFFFLRFVVPALTAPDSYALVREPPDGATIKILVLCGKVLQNLSNDKEMGGKEAYMAKMNEFIVSNRKPMHKFQNNLMTKRENEAGQYAPVPVPQRHADAAAVYLYEYIISRFRHIMEALDTPQPGEDAAAGLTRTQMANMLVHVVGSINQAAGEYAPKPRTANDSVEAVAARRAQGMSLNSSAYSSTAFQSVKMINLTTDMSKLESGNSITPAPITLDSGAGAGTGSMDPTSNPAFGSI